MLVLDDIEKGSSEDRSGRSVKLQIAGFYGDHAVFQHGKTCILRGRAQAGKRVELTVGECRLAIFANQLGEFTFRIPPMKPASGLQMSVVCGDEKALFEDIAFGNVYIAGGQSNMAMLMKMLFPMPHPLMKRICVWSGFFRSRCGAVTAPRRLLRAAGSRHLRKR